MGAALYGPIQSVEIALRNAVERQLAIDFGFTGPWHDDPSFLAAAGNAVARIEDAKVYILDGWARKNLAEDYNRILRIAGWLSGDLSSWIMHHSRVVGRRRLLFSRRSAY